MNAAKQKLAEGKLVLCMGLRQARSPDIAMMAAACGFDALYIDLQHSPLSIETASAICVAAIGQRVTPIVRSPSHAPEWISRVLDGGAQGVLMPDVDDAQAARAIVETNEALNAETLIIAMLETARGVEHADEIAAEPGIDVLLIGSNDLCTELGIPGELGHPRLRAAYECAAAACRKHGKALGVGGIRGDSELQRELVHLGARFIIAGNDTAYLMAAARKDVESLRGLLR